MQHRSGDGLSLYGRDGRRKYLTSSERRAFIAAAHSCPRPELRDLCLMLVYAGCRISEALSLTSESINLDERFVAIRCLKKRGRFVMREVPLPAPFTALLASRLKTLPAGQTRLWPWTRGRAWLLVKQVMRSTGIEAGPHATAKGLRHVYAIHAIRSKVPLNLVSRWLGHSRLSTTAIYADAIGDEERQIAQLMWEDDPQ